MTMGFAVLAVLAVLSTVSAQTGPPVSPLVQYFSTTNSSLYSNFWTALQAAHLDDYLNDTSLTLTIFAPTNDAWLKRMPTLTRANGITVQQLFSESKSAALQNMLQYHILNQPKTTSSFTNADYLGTLANLCSDAKTLQVAVNSTQITLLSAGGTRPVLLDKGIVVGSTARSIVYAIDDVLLPSVVTIPLNVALQNYNTSATGDSNYSPTIAAKQNVLSQLQGQTQNVPLAPVILAPQTAPSAAPGSRPATPATPPASSTTSSRTPPAAPVNPGAASGTSTGVDSTGR